MNHPREGEELTTKNPKGDSKGKESKSGKKLGEDTSQEDAALRKRRNGGKETRITSASEGEGERNIMSKEIKTT